MMTPKPQVGEVWRSKSGRRWRVCEAGRWLRDGHVQMQPLGATGFGGVKARQVEIAGMEKRGWERES